MNRRIMAAMRLRLALALALASIGCATTAETDPIGVGGVIFTDFPVQSTCAELPPLRELSGVALTFVDERGRVLAEARTGEVRADDLPRGDGMAGWRAFGCRFAAPYSVQLPRADRYEVRF